jgi:hypothetical protein
MLIRRLDCQIKSRLKIVNFMVKFEITENFPAGFKNTLNTLFFCKIPLKSKLTRINLF